MADTLPLLSQAAELGLLVFESGGVSVASTLATLTVPDWMFRWVQPRLVRHVLLIAQALIVCLFACPADAGTFTIAWDPNPDPDISGYTVSWGTASGSYTQIVDVGAATSLLFTEPDPTMSYYFAVRARTSTGLISDYSQEVKSTPIVSSSFLSAPAAPSNATAAPSPAGPTNTLAVAWGASASADGYRVARSPDGFTFAEIVELGATATSLVDPGLSAGSTYYYRVYAFNGAGPSAYSNTASARTEALALAPPAPASPSPADGATDENQNVTLRWSCSGAQSYDVYFGSTLYASNLTTPSLSISSLLAGTNYRWSVIAKNNAGATPGPAWSFTTRAKRGQGRK